MCSRQELQLHVACLVTGHNRSIFGIIELHDLCVCQVFTEYRLYIQIDSRLHTN